MSLPELLVHSSAAVTHAQGFLLCAARLVPVVLLCPFLGGSTSPATVRLAVILALATGVHVAGGVGLSRGLDAYTFAAAGVRELVFGLVIGLLAALPFDSARIGGRFVDLFRGSSAEAILPVTGSREAVSGDLLFHLVVASSLSTGVAALLWAALWRTFGAVPLGLARPSEQGVGLVLTVLGTAFAGGLAIAAPIAALSAGVDLLLGFFSRAAPGLHLGELGAPLRILAGGAVLWLSVGLIAQRALEELAGVEPLLRAAGEVSR